MPDPQTLRKILDCPMQPGNDAGAVTVRDYLLKLLALVWEEREEFSGKRPFGNSSWEGEIEAALVKAGVAKGSIDSDGYLEHVDSREVAALVKEAIATLGTETEAEIRKSPGQRAYEAYVAHDQRSGEPVPTWDNESPEMRARWEAAAVAV